MIGYEKITAFGTPWRRHHGALIPLVMPHAVSPLSGPKARQLLVANRALFVRWEEDFDKPEEAEWWHVIKDVPEDLTDLSTNTRSKVRRGLRRFVVARESWESVVSDGYEVYCSAFERYGTFERMLSTNEFYNSVKAISEDTEFWGVRHYDTGTMVAFSENIVRDRACFYNTIWFDPEGLKGYAGYALFHEMNKHYLNERGLYYVSDGARNISHETGIHQFLEQKFLFRRAYSNLRVVYFPGVGLVVRLLYPFRWWFDRRSFGFFRKIAVVLQQEGIRRSCLEPESRT